MESPKQSNGVAVHHAVPSLDPAKVFDGARLVLLGGTGFLGKVFLCMMLDRFPNIGKIHLMVRSSKGRTSEERFWKDVATSEALRPLRERYGDGLEAFLRTKIVPIDGDVGRASCGVADEVIGELKGTVDALVNVAGVVDFNPPLDEALDANAFGVQNLVALARALGDVPLFHTSTCYVAGYRKGPILEVDPFTFPFPRCEELGRELWTPEREIADCLDLIAQARHRCDDAFRQSEFKERAQKSLLSRGEPTEGKALEEELGKAAASRWARNAASSASVGPFFASASISASIARSTGGGPTSTRTRRASASRSSRVAVSSSPSRARRAARPRRSFHSKDGTRASPRRCPSSSSR